MDRAALFGLRIAELREASGFSQAQLAERSHLSERFVQLVESGSSPSFESIFKLADGLGMPPGALFELPSPETIAKQRRRGRPKKQP